MPTLESGYSRSIRNALHSVLSVAAVFLPGFLISLYSQTPTIDSLRRELELHERDTIGVKVCIMLATELSRSNMNESRAYAYRGIEMARKHGTTYGLGAFYAQLTTSYQNSSAADSAKKYLALLGELADRTKGDDDRVNYFMTAGLYYKNQSQFGKAIENLKKALELMDEKKHALTYAGQLLNIGNAYSNLGNVQKAAEYHLMALKKFEKLGNERGQSFCYQSLGNSYLKLKQYQQSLYYFNRSRELKEKLKDARGLISTWNALGNVYYETKNYEASLENYSMALSQARSLKLHLEEVRSMFDIGVLYSKMNRLAEVRSTLNQALPLARQVGDSLLVARIRSELSKIDVQSGNASKAEADITKKLAAARHSGDLTAELYAYLDLSDHYARQGDFENAYKFLQRHHHLRDSVAGKEIVVKFQEMEQRYQKDKREQEIALLKKDQQLTQEVIGRQRASQKISMVALAGVVLIALLGFFYLRLRYISRRRAELDQVRNAIARDLHDDIGSALSSISIMSQLALHDKGDARRHLQKISESSAKMMEGMSDIVWSINPDNESIEKMVIRMKEFASEILEPANIRYSIQVKGNLDSVVLDPQSRKNVFLVFKESINNAAKHSGGTEVVVELSAQKGTLELRIADNGKGFETDVSGNGNGLNNMIFRGNDVKGTTRIKTSPGGGTEVLLELPIT